MVESLNELRQLVAELRAYVKKQKASARREKVVLIITMTMLAIVVVTQILL